MPVGASEVAERRRAVLVDAPQERVRGTGQVDARGRGQPGMAVAAGPEPVQLLEPPLDRAHVVHRPDPNLFV